MRLSLRTLSPLLIALLTLAAAPAMADMAEQKALSKKALDYWSGGDLGSAAEVFGYTYQNHQVPDVAGTPKTIDLEEWTKTVTSYRSAFPVTKVEILQQLGEGDRVSTQWRFEATQEGVYLGLAPTGKTVSWTGIQIDRFEDGKIAESWVNWDMYSMFKQLGLLE